MPRRWQLWHASALSPRATRPPAFVPAMVAATAAALGPWPLKPARPSCYSHARDRGSPFAFVLGGWRLWAAARGRGFPGNRGEARSSRLMLLSGRGGWAGAAPLDAAPAPSATVTRSNVIVGWTPPCSHPLLACRSSHSTGQISSDRDAVPPLALAAWVRLPPATPPPNLFSPRPGLSPVTLLMMLWSLQSVCAVASLNWFLVVCTGCPHTHLLARLRSPAGLPPLEFTCAGRGRDRVCHCTRGGRDRVCRYGTRGGRDVSVTAVVNLPSLEGVPAWHQGKQPQAKANHTASESQERLTWQVSRRPEPQATWRSRRPWGGASAGPWDHRPSCC